MEFTSTSTGNFMVTYSNSKTGVPTEITPYAVEDFYGIVATTAINNLAQVDPETFAQVLALQPESQEKFNEALMDVSSSYLQACLDEIVDTSLKGKVDEAWNMLLPIANFSENDLAVIASGQDAKKVVVYPEHLKLKFANIEDVQDYIGFLEEIGEFHNGAPILNPYELAKRVTSYEDILTDDQRSQVYLSCARLFYPQDLSKARHPDYSHYLNKAVDCSSDYTIIADCERYLGVLGDTRDNRNLKDAYKRVILRAKKEKDYKSVYGAAVKLKDMYNDIINKKMGYRSLNNFGYEEKLNKALEYQKLAIAADKKLNGKISISELKELSKIYELSCRDGEWVDNQKRIADLLKGKDRYVVLTGIIPKLDSNKLGYTKELLTRLQNDGKVKASDKKVILNMMKHKISHCVGDKDVAEVNKQISAVEDFISNPKVKPIGKSER